MRQLSKIQTVLLAMLKDFDAFCREHELSYFLGEGNLLGAIRHQGFIPWDDDQDIFMQRAEFQRFLKLASEKYDKKYEVQHYTTVDNYWSSAIKLRLLNVDDPELIQKSIAHLTENNGPFIDVAPFDYVAKDSGLLVFWQYYRIRYLRMLLTMKLKLKPADSLVRRILTILAKGYSTNYIHRRIDKLHMFYGPQPRKYIALYSTYHGNKLPIVTAQAFEKTLWLPYEDGLYPVPQGYDEILTRFYGDYMKLPPESERVGKHHFD